jgi:hypothetical protein
LTMTFTRPRMANVSSAQFSRIKFDMLMNV